MGSDQSKPSDPHGSQSPAATGTARSGSIGDSPSGAHRKSVSRRLSAVFKNYATSQSGIGHSTMTLSDFEGKMFLGSPSVGQFIFSYLSPSGTALSSANFMSGTERIMSFGGESSLIDFYFKMKTGPTDVLSADDLRDILTMCCNVDLASVGITDAGGGGVIVSGSDAVLDALSKSLCSPGETTADLSRFRSWCTSNCPLLFHGLHCYVCARMTGDIHALHCGSASASHNALVKNCESGGSAGSLSTIWLLSCVLAGAYFPAIEQASTATSLMKIVHTDGWHVIYDSASQGLSVNRFQHHIMDYRGPTIMFVTFQNFVYIVAVDCQWTESCQRWGGSDFILIQLLPNFRIHQRGAGLMYFNLSDRTAPKGIAIGKDRSIFLKIDGELEKVNHYGVDIKLASLEIWGCGGKSVHDAQLKHKAWEKNAVTKEQNRKLVPEDWKESADRQLLELGGVKTDHNERNDI